MADDRHLVEQNFAELDHQLRHQGPGVGLAEIDGMACGMLAAGRSRPAADDWQTLLGSATAHAAIDGVLGAVFGLASRSLGGAGFDFAPLVPDEDADCGERIEAVADWCSGFVQGLRRVTDATPEGAAGEAIGDILRLAELTPDDRPAEQQQRDLEEVIEYLRVAVQLVHDTFNHAPVAATGKPRP